MVTIPHSVLCTVLKDLGTHITEEDVDQIVAACGWSDTIDYPYLELVQHLSIFNMAMVAARSALEIICRGSSGPTAPAALSSAVHWLCCSLCDSLYCSLCNSAHFTCSDAPSLTVLQPRAQLGSQLLCLSYLPSCLTATSLQVRANDLFCPVAF